MLTGRSRNTLDSKGRLAIPAKWRDFIGADKEGDDVYVWVAPGLNDNLHIYPRSTWMTLAAEVDKYSPFDEAASALRADFFGLAEGVKMDKAGRVIIPEELREKAGIDKDVVIVGALDQLYVWSAESYADRKPSSTAELFSALRSGSKAEQ